MRPSLSHCAFRPFAHVLALALALSLTTATTRAQVVADPYESSVALLKQATHAQADGSHLPLLFALRQLRDPDLKSLFLQLTQEGGKEGDWPIQVHAVLGLAEIDPKKQIDPWLITKITPDAQEAVIASALDGHMLPPEAVKEILQWDQLNPMARLFLIAEQVSLAQPVDAEELARLSKSDDTHVAGLSSALLAQGGKSEAFTAFLSQIAVKPAVERDAVTNWLMDGARRYKLTSLCDWIAQANAPASAHAETDPDLVYRSTVALLSLDQARGLPAWERFLGSEPPFPHRVRCGIILLSAREKAPAAAYDKLLTSEPDEELIACIANVGKAITAGTDPADALIALLDIGHAKSTLWVMEYLKEVPPEQARRVYEYLIDRLNSLKPQWKEAIAQAVDATTRLIAIDPDAVLSRLSSAEDDSALQQALLLGMFESDSPQVGTAAAKLPRIGSGRADSLALLLTAKHSSSLTPDQLKQLGMIASGGGRVSEILQVQAAWLYLKRSGKVDQAMAAVFAKQP